ncbi:MAG TPA: hydrogen peroxide-dependent heme synthase [Actinomycetota bacterium]|nr:hydrogen peroxide-dependent heme synthase [Actinomycetota bacterium]
MTDELILASYPVFKAIPGALDDDRDIVTKEADALFEEFADRVSVRGTYSTAGFRADADLIFWWVAKTADDIQDLTTRFRRTQLGRALEPREMFLGVVRPAEFSKDHLPAFVKGEDPKKFLCVYPFVRTPQWYLLDPKDRGQMLRDHGEAGREYPDVLANTTSAFGLGDYEWILAFEADTPERIVELIRRLRATEARRYTKLEIPFFMGIRKQLAAVVEDLP